MALTRLSPVFSMFAAASLTLEFDSPTGQDRPVFAKALPTIRSGPPKVSFNGRDLAGFYSYTRQSKFDDQNQVFTVRDGCIRVSGKEMGGLVTREPFADYHLVVEWKWGRQTWYPRRHAARNSGIMVHGRGPDGDALACWLESIECQIIEGGAGDLIVAPGKGKSPSLTSTVRVGLDGQPYYDPGGQTRTIQKFRFNWWGRDPGWKDILGFRGPDDLENPVGEWNRTELICDGDSITCIINGTLANVATRSSMTSGKITLQSEGAEIYFRKFEVRPLLK